MYVEAIKRVLDKIRNIQIINIYKLIKGLGRGEVTGNFGELWEMHPLISESAQNLVSKIPQNSPKIFIVANG